MPAFNKVLKSKTIALDSQYVMNSPHQISELNFKKLGLLAMTPIALMMHGLVLWIPVNTEIKKENVPEKEAQLQAIGNMPLPIASPTAIPLTASTPASSPTTTASKSSTSPVIVERIVEKVIQTQSQPKPSESPVKPPATPVPTPIVSPTPLPTEALTPEGTVNKLLTGIPCPGESRCSQVSAPQDKILATLAKQFGNQHQEINDTASPEDAGDRPTESQVVGYRIKDNKTNKFLYFILPPVAGNKVNVIFKDENQIIALGGVL